MPKSADPAVRRALVERAAEMLARREAVTLRSLVAGTGMSTMAVYTHFDGMDGVWRAVRQEGFTRLSARLAGVRATADPVRDLVALGAGYLANALEHPDLYRAMFDARADLEDPQAADDAFGLLIGAAARAREAGRFAPGADPAAIATGAWVFGHGLASLAGAGLLVPDAVSSLAVADLEARYVAAGDEPDACRRSVRNGWRAFTRGSA